MEGDGTGACNEENRSENMNIPFDRPKYGAQHHKVQFNDEPTATSYLSFLDSEKSPKNDDINYRVQLGDSPATTSIDNLDKNTYIPNIFNFPNYFKYNEIAETRKEELIKELKNRPTNLIASSCSDLEANAYNLRDQIAEQQNVLDSRASVTNIDNLKAKLLQLITKTDLQKK